MLYLSLHAAAAALALATAYRIGYRRGHADGRRPPTAAEIRPYDPAHRRPGCST